MSDQQLEAMIIANQKDMRIASACVLFMAAFTTAFVVLSALY